MAKHHSFWSQRRWRLSALFRGQLMCSLRARLLAQINQESFVWQPIPREVTCILTSLKGNKFVLQSATLLIKKHGKRELSTLSEVCHSPHCLFSLTSHLPWSFSAHCILQWWTCSLSQGFKQSYCETSLLITAFILIKFIVFMFYSILFLEKNVPVVFCSEDHDPSISAFYQKYKHINRSARDLQQKKMNCKY